jgi:hypothetical protein
MLQKGDIIIEAFLLNCCKSVFLNLLQFRYLLYLKMTPSPWLLVEHSVTPSKGKIQKVSLLYIRHKCLQKQVVMVVGHGRRGVLSSCAWQWLQWISCSPLYEESCIPGISLRELQFSCAVWQRMMLLLTRCSCNCHAFVCRLCGLVHLAAVVEML